MGLTKKLKQKWVRALKSGKYAQTTACLQNGNGFCCLGVLCDIVDNSKWKINKQGETTYNLSNTGLMPRSMGILSKKIQSDLAGMNDDGATFEEIAEYIKTNLKTVD